MKPFINHKEDLGFVFQVKCGSSTMRAWCSQNGFDPIPPFKAKRLIGIVRDPMSRFVSMVQQYMNVYAKNNLQEDPEVFDRTWPQLRNLLIKNPNEWYSLNVHFVTQVSLYNSYPITEYWPLEELDKNLQPIIEEHGYTQPIRKKEGNAIIKQKILEQIDGNLESIVLKLYKEDNRLYQNHAESVKRHTIS